MTDRVTRNRQFLESLFAGPFTRHGFVYSSPPVPLPEGFGDYSTSNRPVRDWVSNRLADYEARVRWLDALDDDSVPYVDLKTHTGVFASAFGCAMADHPDSLSSARPCVFTAGEADRLPEPSLGAPSLSRFFELAERIYERVGPEVPISVPDIQSPFDIAALVWNKQDFYVATVENPDAVKRLVAKCGRLLRRFLLEFRRRFPEPNLCHCPDLWIPPALGCSLSEDEAGCMSVAMFEEFCLPALIDLSETFGGMFVHCCATADYQYPSFLRIPNLRGMNRVFQAPGPGPAIRAFSGRAVLVMAWVGEETVRELLDAARPDTRYLFNLTGFTLDDARRTLDRLRQTDTPTHDGSVALPV